MHRRAINVGSSPKAFGFARERPKRATIPTCFELSRGLSGHTTRENTQRRQYFFTRSDAPALFYIHTAQASQASKRAVAPGLAVCAGGPRHYRATRPPAAHVKGLAGRIESALLVREPLLTRRGTWARRSPPPPPARSRSCCPSTVRRCALRSRRSCTARACCSRPRSRSRARRSPAE